MVLEEKNISYQVKEEDLSHLSGELLSLHPEGVVPLLIDKNQVLYESSIITEYLDESFEGVKLMPSNPGLRAQVRLWTYWCNKIFKPDLDLAKYEWGSLDADKKKGLKIKIYSYLKKIEGTLSASDFLVGKEFTLADIHVFPFLRQLVRVKGTDLDLSQYVRSHQWLSELENRDSFKSAMRKLP
jgi:glutathione S-transferase